MGDADPKAEEVSAVDISQGETRARSPAGISSREAFAGGATSSVGAGFATSSGDPGTAPRRTASFAATGSSAPTAHTLDIRVANKFRMLEKLGAGSFGDIFKGMDIETGETVAIKLEPVQAKNPLLFDEARIIKLLSKDGPPGNPTNVDPRGVAQLFWYGIQGDFHVMVCSLLGPSLEDLHAYCGRRLSLRTVCNLGKQMISRVEYMHSKHMLHRDIKPDNFLVGMGRRASTVYIIDFGLSKPYRDPKSLEHIPFKSGKGLSGTARYTSIATHLGYEQSRRDDLEAIGYVVMYLLKGVLPWQGMAVPKPAKDKGKDKGKNKDDLESPKSPASPGSPGSPGAKRQHAKAGREKKPDPGKDKNRFIGLQKVRIGFAALCKGYPSELCTYLRYCAGLRFTDKPDYDYARGLFTQIEERNGWDSEHTDFDWIVKRRKELGLSVGDDAVAPSNRSPRVRYAPGS
eukprot:TRINITY_DN51658_c0_g1_i1.p1 TRINITY_DN51658_c0_g1~~TRINITY_DN51658_c0_g1_i1.p1  ORF type:complete len:459 (+),score=123.77 TRINITY_DN51658_c0_g1_i1:151-1527(+)